MSLYGVIGYHVTLSEGHMVANHPIYGVIGYHVTLWEGSQSPHIWGDWLSCDPLRTPYKETLMPHLVGTFIYLLQIYSYYVTLMLIYPFTIRGSNKTENGIRRDYITSTLTALIYLYIFV